jgi:hypothetical protein
MDEIKLRVVGHEIVTVNEKVGKGRYEATERLQVKLRGVDGNKRTRATLLVEPDDIDDFPLREIGEMSFAFRQGRLPLAKGKGRAAAAN